MGKYFISDYSNQPRSCLFILSTYLAQSLSVEVPYTLPRDTVIGLLYNTLYTPTNQAQLQDRNLRQCTAMYYILLSYSFRATWFSIS